MKIVNYYTFENIKHYTDDGIEFWYAKELQEVLEYKQWRRFFSVIEKAMAACENFGNTVVEHFANVGKTIAMPKGASKKIDDFMLSRYACYLIVQNGDPRKEIKNNIIPIKKELFFKLFLTFSIHILVFRASNILIPK